MPRPKPDNFIDACPECGKAEAGIRPDFEMNGSSLQKKPSWRIMPHGVPRCVGSGQVVPLALVRNRSAERRLSS